MNPYDFVRIDWERGVERRPAVEHDRFEGLSGQIEGTITTLTPCFVREPKSEAPFRIRYERFVTNGAGDPIIPGSSLKGLIRSLVETIGPGCWWLFDGLYENDKVDYRSKLPNEFQQCQRADDLCVACRMFGMVQGQGNQRLLGHVKFEDAVCRDPVDHAPIYTIILSTPKPRHVSFHLDSSGKVAGRKFYFHHATPVEDVEGWLPKKASSEYDAQNQYIKPIGADSVFHFSLSFDGLSKREYQLLLYTLMLEDGVRHKLGYGKPAGLGSVEVALTRLKLMDYAKRYKTALQEGDQVYEDDALDQYLSEEIAPYVTNRSSVTLQDLRRIWKWPGRDDLRYPDWSWFQDPENRRKPIAETP